MACTANAGRKREGKSIAIGLVPLPTSGGGAVAVTADSRTALQVRCIFNVFSKKCANVKDSFARVLWNGARRSQMWMVWPIQRLMMDVKGAPQQHNNNQKKNISSSLLGLSSYHNHIHCIEYCIKVCFVCFCSYVVEYDNSRAAEEEEDDGLLKEMVFAIRGVV